jgi:hypothetical protein
MRHRLILRAMSLGECADVVPQSLLVIVKLPLFIN